ncbi:MAG: hypothetical protein ACLSTO_06260 [Bilophila wadsworthia]
MIWPDREKDLGHTCIENHIPGVFFCRHCGRTGDSIRYMMDMEGMSFREACAELGISDMPVRPRRRPAPLEPQVRAAWQPSVKEVPSEKWRNYAAKLLAEAEAEIWNHPEALNWLAKRGITEEVIRTYRLGYLAGEDGKPGRFRARSVLGLPPKQRNGKDQTWLFIPRGIVIPTFEGGELINLRIRRPNQDIKEREDGTRPAKYLELSAPVPSPCCCFPKAAIPISGRSLSWRGTGRHPLPPCGRSPDRGRGYALQPDQAGHRGPRATQECRPHPAGPRLRRVRGRDCRAGVVAFHVCRLPALAHAGGQRPRQRL